MDWIHIEKDPEWKAKAGKTKEYMEKGDTMKVLKIWSDLENKAKMTGKAFVYDLGCGH